MSFKFSKWILIAILATPLAQAFNFAGHWEGKGTYILKGDLTQCSVMRLVFTEKNDEFSFQSGRRECDKHNEDFYKVTMTLKNGQVMFGAEVVGDYTDNTMSVSYRMPDGDSFRNWRMSMKRQGNHLMYEESRTMEGEITPLISFAGLLLIQD